MSTTVPAPAPARTPARPARPSVKAAWSWENRKSGNRWYWPVVVLVCALGLAAGSWQYVSYAEVFASQGLTWEAIWVQSLQMPGLLFLPLACGALVAQTSAAEHEGRSWQRMRANGLAGALVAGKLLHNLQVAALTCAIFYLEVAAVGLYLGFNPTWLLAALPRLGVMSLGTWAVLTFTTWLGLVIRSFSGVMTTVITGSVASFGLLLAKPLMPLSPMALITWCGSYLDPRSITSAGSVAMAGIVALVWGGLMSLAIRRAVRRQS
ncbi:MAG: ABC transporter permease [Actinomycetia bacterium]|nr:ABC transporter permease [Actinomycetes bacterium]